MLTSTLSKSLGSPHRNVSTMHQKQKQRALPLLLRVLPTLLASFAGLLLLTTIYLFHLHHAHHDPEDDASELDRSYYNNNDPHSSPGGGNNIDDARAKNSPGGSALRHKMDLAQFLLQKHDRDGAEEGEERAAMEAGGWRSGNEENFVNIGAKMDNALRGGDFGQDGTRLARRIAGRPMEATSPLDNETFFSSLFERGENFKLVPIKNNPPEEEESNDINNDSICVVVRTYARHGRKLQTLLSALETIATSIKSKDRDLQIILANTDSRATDDENASFFYNALNPVVVQTRASNLRGEDGTVVSSSKVSYNMAVLPEGMVPNEELFGYDVTQLVLDDLLNSRTIHCSSFLFTNGDNYYHPELLVETGLDTKPSAPAQKPGKLVAFDYITHHKRPDPDGIRNPNQRIVVKFIRGHVDLGSVFVEAEAIRNCKGAAFQDLGKYQENFASDWHFFNALLHCGAEIQVIHQVLFMHQ